ncbi:MAG: amino acid permease [Acidobacteria bacterium]|nr:amino acid permease [Acidobacteriota bacterium]
MASSASGAQAQPQAPELLRQIGLISASALVVSNMIGTGVFGTTGFLAGDLGSPSIVLWIWVVGALCALLGAFCYSELGVNFPSSGGEFVYLTQAYGPTWGFMTGWVSFFAGFSGPIALAALAFSEYLGYFWPGLKQANAQYSFGPEWFTLKLGGAQLAASLLIAVLTVINLFGVKPVAAIQNALTANKLAVIFGLIFFGLAAGTGSWDHFNQPATRWTTKSIEAQFFISLFFIYLSYSGWNAATYVAEEIQQPAKTLPRALAFGTGAVAILYLLLNVVFIYAVPLEKMKGEIAIGSLAASALFGPAVSGVFAALFAVSLTSTVNAMVTIGPRVYYAMAKNGAFLAMAAEVHPQWRTPVSAILLQGVVTIVMTLTPFPSLVMFVGFLLNFFATVTVASLFIFRKRPGWQKLPVVSFAWPLVPLGFILVGAWMTIFGFTLQPRVAVTAAVIVAAGALLFHFTRKPQEINHA